VGANDGDAAGGAAGAAANAAPDDGPLLDAYSGAVIGALERVARRSPSLK